MTQDHWGFEKFWTVRDLMYNFVRLGSAILLLSLKDISGPVVAH